MCALETKIIPCSRNAVKTEKAGRFQTREPAQVWMQEAAKELKERPGRAASRGNVPDSPEPPTYLFASSAVASGCPATSFTSFTRLAIA
jgi:hypothetical protein